MRLLIKLAREQRPAFALVSCLSVASAGLNVFVIAFVNSRLLEVGAGRDWTSSLLEFGALLALLFVLGTAAHVTMSTLGHRLVYALRRSLVGRVLKTDIERLEKLG